MKLMLERERMDAAKQAACHERDTMHLEHPPTDYVVGRLAEAIYRCLTGARLPIGEPHIIVGSCRATWTTYEDDYYASPSKAKCRCPQYVTKLEFDRQLLTREIDWDV